MTDITPHQDPSGEHGSTPARLGYSPVADIPHRPRATDTDPKAARRAERQVATMFLLSMLFVALFVVAYITIDPQAIVYIPVMGDVGASNVALGFTMGMAILLIGTGAIQWAKKLMPDVEVVQQRHDMASPKRATLEAEANYERGKEESGFARFPIIRRTLIGALVLFPIPLVLMLRDLWTPNEFTEGKSPEELLSTTMWTSGMRIISDGTYQGSYGEVDSGGEMAGDISTTGDNVSSRPVRPEDIPVGGLVAAIPLDLPEVEHEEGSFNARAKAAIILVRMEPDEIRSQQGDGWDYQGILAYSKICTHVGCPIALYEQRTHHLLCPCHQSTFDLADSGNVVFGPAARRMPQLPIGVDEEGYLVARSDFQEPVGPSFWERG
ncbi:MAG TPA: ubiquinol-cytochrome C reductase [Actinobacteria bacterium]|jgi:ubiquinol-cytochrome c reductase iron-sulfur subunit|nr:ubiquinol-cytochrome C reductase [Actinomycetota bacterium]